MSLSSFDNSTCSRVTSSCVVIPAAAGERSRRIDRNRAAVESPAPCGPRRCALTASLMSPIWVSMSSLEHALAMLDRKRDAQMHAGADVARVELVHLEIAVVPQHQPAFRRRMRSDRVPSCGERIELLGTSAELTARGRSVRPEGEYGTATEDRPISRNCANTPRPAPRIRASSISSVRPSLNRAQPAAATNPTAMLMTSPDTGSPA